MQRYPDQMILEQTIFGRGTELNKISVLYKHWCQIMSVALHCKLSSKDGYFDEFHNLAE